MSAQVPVVMPALPGTQAFMRAEPLVGYAVQGYLIRDDYTMALVIDPSNGDLLCLHSKSLRFTA